MTVDPNPNRDRQGADTMSWADAHGTDAPLAYLITFRTYATWLPGDARGTVDRLHNQPGTPLLPPDPRRREGAHRRTGVPIVLSPAHRDVVQGAIIEVCRHRRWELYALNVRSNHIHVVVSGAETPERILNAFKAWSTRRMRQADLLPAEVQPWSRHGSTRYLWKADQVQAACRYVQEAQDEQR